MTLGQIVKRALGCAGIKAYSWQKLPWGIDLERDLQRVFSGRAKTTFFDVGANIGQTSRRLRHAFPASKIFAFEPIAATHEALRANTAHLANLATFPLALGDRDGSAEMTLFPKSAWNRIATESASAGAGPRATVDLRKLDGFCAEHRITHIDLLKTDCEGYDLQVLHGASRMLAAGQIDAVLCEINFQRNGLHGDFFAIHDYLAAHRFYFLALYDCGGWHTARPESPFHNGLWLRSTTRN
jgi:FkbM family methyltransferase